MVRTVDGGEFYLGLRKEADAAARDSIAIGVLAADEINALGLGEGGEDMLAV
jgi:hypothetical protein